MIYNKGYDCYINLNYLGGIDVIYKGNVLKQYIGSEHTCKKHPYPLVYVPDHGEACVHRLVAYCFGILTDKGQIIDHIDNNPYNNHPFNLRVADSHTNQEFRKEQQERTPEMMAKWEEHWRSTTCTK